jgi:hypothetical protein
VLGISSLYPLEMNGIKVGIIYKKRKWESACLKRQLNSLRVMHFVILPLMNLVADYPLML